MLLVNRSDVFFASEFFLRICVEIINIQRLTSIKYALYQFNAEGLYMKQCSACNLVEILDHLPTW